MRYVFMALLLVGVACSAPPRRSSAGRAATLTIQHCSAMSIDAAPTGRPAAAATPATPARPPAQVRVGDIAVAGGEDAVAGQIRTVIDEALPRLRRCYEQTLETMPGLEGKLAVAFRVDATGKVGRAEGRAGFHPGVTACVEEVVRTLAFPATAGAVDATVPLTFRLPDDAAVAAPPAPADKPVDRPAAPATPGAAPVFPGDADAFARTVVEPAVESRREAIVGCARSRGEPVQYGFEVTLAVRGPSIGDSAVEGLLDPAMELCIAGVLRDLPLAAAPSAPTGARCQMVLRSR